jgi:hypothetical protein
VTGVLVALALVVGGFGWDVYRLEKGLKFQLRVLRQRIGASASPDESVVVDDRVLGWALRRGEGRGAQIPLFVVGDDTVPSSLLAELASCPREIVVVARPDSRLLRTLNAAGYAVVTEAGSAPWDTRSVGSLLLGWGKMRIFFVMRQKTTEDGTDVKGAALSSSTTQLDSNLNEVSR